MPADQRGFADDPDLDGIINAYEFLARTNANDINSGMPPLISAKQIDGLPYIMYTFYVDPSIQSVVPQVQFSVSPDFKHGLPKPDARRGNQRGRPHTLHFPHDHAFGRRSAIRSAANVCQLMSHSWGRVGWIQQSDPEFAKKRNLLVTHCV